jgi:alcohol dehydrogenase class IV
MTAPFTFNTAASIRFGDGLLGEIGTIVAAAGHANLLLVTDPGMVATGIVDTALASLSNADVTATLYSEVEADPHEAIIYRATDLARKVNAEMIIGLGGGSSLDVAKLAALLAPGMQPVDQALDAAYGVGNATGPRLPLILVPTTAGTGSEVTPISIVTTGKSEKMGVVSPIILPDIALLDPELTLSVPPHVTAATGIDAMVHAIEAYASASANNNPISRQMATQALTLLGGAVETAVHEGGNRQARADMLLGSMLAGQAFANSPVAAVHALAYPIGGHFKIPHGLSNALVLAHVLRFNAVSTPRPYAEMAPFVFPEQGAMGPQEAASAFAEGMAELAARCGLEARLRDVGIPKDALDLLARDAMNQTRLLVNNPREVAENDARAIYAAAW